MPEHILQPPPPTPIKQTAASRTRSRTSLAAKVAAEAGVSTKSPSPSPASAVEDAEELVKDMDEFSCVVNITDTANAMDVSPDNSTLQVNYPPPAASQLVDDCAMDVDKSEEIAVQEQLRLISPTVSEMGTDHAQSNGDRPNTGYMDIETELADKQTGVVPSRYFTKGPEKSVITLDSQGQQIGSTSVTDSKPGEEEDSDQQEDDVDDGPNPSQKFVSRIFIYYGLIELITERIFSPWIPWVQNTIMWLSDLKSISRWKPRTNGKSPILVVH
jgi:hypothetical protein